MARRIPPELRRRAWTSGTVWELLVAADLLPYRFTSPCADLGIRARERRHWRREQELLTTTKVRYILPYPGSAQRLPQPWLSVQTMRAGYYRVNDAGLIERYGRQLQRFGGTTVTKHRWYPCTLRGVRWLHVIATGRMVQKLGMTATDDDHGRIPPD